MELENKISISPNHIWETHQKLIEYCRQKDWAGYDPYDALNSKVFSSIPIFNNRITRIGLTQILKRLPINLRQFLLVSRELNPKAIALFLMAFVRLSRLNIFDCENYIASMVEKLVALRSHDSPYWCWGYSFPWQTRTIMVPRGAPNLVCTTFVANALLDAYEANHDARCLSMAVNAGDYILNDLYWTTDAIIAGFCYPLPSSRGFVHNSNFLASALFCRIYKITGEEKYVEPALKVARYSATRQHDNGSWPYGESPTQQWIDNFHTGYNLCALRSICNYLESKEFEPHIRKGFEFYRHYFFREDSAPRYYHDRTYPIDTHCVAQSIITLCQLYDLDDTNVNLALSVYNWGVNNMWDDRGYFYYQVFPYFKNKISYMRWSQAWMFLALSTLLEHCNQTEAAK